MTIHTNLSREANGGEVFLLAHTRQQVRKAEKKVFINGSATFNLKSSDFGDGVSHITVFDSQQKPICERLIFQAPERKLELNTTLNGSSFAQRKEVNVDISTIFNGKPATSNLSMAVYQVDSLSTAAVTDMQSYLLLTSDIRGYVESPAFYFSNTADAKEAADNLMMTQGWRRFSWNQAFARSQSAPAYPPEFDGHIVGATITYNSGQKPASGIKAYLSVPGTKTQFYPAITDNEGKAYFDVRDYLGKNELVVQTEVLADSNYRIDIADPFSDRYSSKPDKQRIHLALTKLYHNILKKPGKKGPVIDLHTSHKKIIIFSFKIGFLLSCIMSVKIVGYKKFPACCMTREAYL
ncbi:MAG: hypothetical protein EOO01_41040, partial [Chitinophagaceae bacterium]